MNPRIWRTSALTGSVALVVLLATQQASGQPPAIAAAAAVQIPQSIRAAALDQPLSPMPAIPESASLLLLGAAFAILSRQLRRAL